jgi:small-conductance mechanosensitive channel
LKPVADKITTLTGLSPYLQHNIVWSVATIIVLWLLWHLFVRIVARRLKDAHGLFMWRKAATNASMVLGIVIIGGIWFNGFQSLTTFAGLFVAGLVIALRDLLVNMAGWMFILWRKPFVIGQRIQIGDIAGDVVNIRLFQFSLLEIGNWVAADQPTGRVVQIPNGKIFTEPQSIYHGSFDYIWNEIPVLITFESDWKKAKKTLSEICTRHASHVSEAARTAFRDAANIFLLTADEVEPRVYTKVEGSGVLLTLRYLCPPNQRRVSEEAIWEEILDAFAACDDIDFAYPTSRIYKTDTEDDLPRANPK